MCMHALHCSHLKSHCTEPARSKACAVAGATNWDADEVSPRNLPWDANEVSPVVTPLLTNV